LKTKKPNNILLVLMESEVYVQPNNSAAFKKAFRIIGFLFMRALETIRVKEPAYCQ
jgi:hypothetical protein